MNMSDLDYGAESGVISNSTLEQIGVRSISYDKMLSLDNGSNGLTHMTAETMEGKTIDLGNFDIGNAREFIRNAILSSKEGFTQLLDQMKGV